MKRPSLVYQAKEILSPLFNEGFGRSKHNDKKNDQDKGLIYSRNTYKNILEKCCTFLSYCKENYGLRFLNQIKPEFFNGFIQNGNNGAGYNKKTANAYKAAVQKLQDGYNARNKDNCIWIDEGYKSSVNTGTVKSRLQMPREIHDNIINKAYRSKCETGLAFDIARSLGLRVTEITNLRMKDFWFDRAGKLKAVYIHCSKGGRHRVILSRQLTDRQIQTAVKVYDYFRDSRNKNDRLFVNKSGSYQRAFERIRDSVSDGYKHCGIHSMRKEFAKDFYNREIEKGRNIKEIKKELTQLLGHNRLDILRHYLK